MTLSERQTVAAVQPVHATAPGPAAISNDARVQAKLFRSSDPQKTLDDMNAWLTKMSGDGRINVVNSESQVWPVSQVESEFLVIVYFMIR